MYIFSRKDKWEDHYRAIFDILAHLQQNRGPDLMRKFRHFLLSQCRSKLGRRFADMRTEYESGALPFDYLSKKISTPIQTEYTVSLSLEQYEAISTRIQFPLPPHVDQSSIRIVVQSTEGVQAWLSFLQRIWGDLESLLLTADKKGKFVMRTYIDVHRVDTLLNCLRLLRPFLKTILMSGEIDSRLQEISESSSIFILYLLIFNLVVASQDLPTSFQDEEPDDEVPMDSNPSKPYKFLLIIMFLTASSGEGVNDRYPWSARLCRSFDLVTAWTSAWEILSDALNADFFADLQLYIYTPASPRQLLLPADHKLNQYLEDLRSPADRLHGPCLEMVLERNQGKLHAEAQLMAFLQGRPVSAAYQL